MNGQEGSTAGELFQLDGKPSVGQALPLALQHVVAMIVGCVTPAIIVSGAGGLSAEDSVILVQAALVMSAVTTLVQLYPVLRGEKFSIGSGLPVIMGISFAYVPSMQAIAGDFGIASIFGAQIIGGIIAVIVGIFIKQIRKFFPPLITGTVVFAIGLSLYPTAINYMAGGTGSENYGSWQNWLVAFITLVIVTGLNHYGKGIWKLSSILIGIIAGYVVALFFGMVDFSAVSQASFFQLPRPLHFGVKFELSSCVAIGILFAINSIQAIGDFTATTTGGMDRMPKDEELNGGIVAYGICNMICPLFGGLPTATFSQNVGIVSSTKVVAKRVFGLAAGILLIAGLIPKFSSILTTIPSCVLGGATVSVFASIAMTGVKLVTASPMNYRNTTIVGLAIALGMGITQANAALASFPEWVTTIFGRSPVVLATIVAIILNLVLPKEQEDPAIEIMKKEGGRLMLVIGNGKLFTRDDSLPYIENGAVAVEGTKIAAVGTAETVRNTYKDCEYIDAKGGVIMPAFINTHEHIYSAMARGLSIKGYNPKGFLDILDGQWWTIDRHLTLEQTKYSAMDTMISCIRNGVTTIFDHHASFGQIKGSLFTIAEAARQLGVRACLCYEISDRDGMDKAKESVMENAEFIRYALKDDTDMTAGMMGMHAQFTISDETMELAAAEKPEEAGYHIHVAEGIEDLHDCLKKYGKRIVDRLMDCGILGEKTLLGHCIYINSHEMDLIKETDTMVVHNPESNMGNACGCPPTMELVRRGILTGLGTDGYTHDMTESFKVANVLHKHHLCDPNAAWGEVPKMLFENNAKIANRYFKAPLGVLKEGAAADVIVVDYDPPTRLDETNINGHILFGMTGRDVVTTVGNGKVLMKDREVKTADVKEVMAKCREEAAKLWKSING